MLAVKQVITDITFLILIYAMQSIKEEKASYGEAIKAEVNRYSWQYSRLAALLVIICYPLYYFTIYLKGEPQWNKSLPVSLLMVLVFTITVLLVKKRYDRSIILMHVVCSAISLFAFYQSTFLPDYYQEINLLSYALVFVFLNAVFVWHFHHAFVQFLFALLLFVVFIADENMLSNRGGVLWLVSSVGSLVLTQFRYKVIKQSVIRNIQLGNKNKQLKEKHEELIRVNTQLQRAHEEVKVLNNSLEEKVDIRTKSLQESNLKLGTALEELDRFLYNSAHALKGPILRFQGLINLARVDNPDYIHQHIDNLEVESGNMLNIVKKLNTINYINEGPEKEIKSIADVVNELKALYEDQLKASEIRFQVNLNNQVFTLQYPTLIQAILENIVENAIQFSRSSDRVDSYISLEIGRDDNCLKIVVEDNGSGISDDDLPHVYNMFYRGSLRSKGSGLGLYIVKRSVEKLKGEVFVKSRHGELTRINLTFPAEHVIKNTNQLLLKGTNKIS